jgi:translocation and assembly module TamB
MRRRTKLLVLALLAAAAAFVGTRLPEWSVRFVSGRLASFTHTPSSVGRVRLGFFPLRVEIRDLKIGGRTAADPPFIAIREVVVRPGLILPRFIRLARVDIVGLDVHITAFSGGGENIPPFGTGGKGRTSLRIGRLVIREGAFVLDHRRVPMEMDLPDFTASVGSRNDGAVAGHVSFPPGQVLVGAGPPLPFGTEVEMLLKAGLVTVTSARVRAQNIDLGYRGQIRISSRPTGRFALQGPVDLAVLDHHLLHTGYGLKGAARFDGVFTVDGPNLGVAGKMEGAEGEYDGVPVDRFEGGVEWGPRGLRLEGLDLQALGGHGRLDLEVPKQRGQTIRLESDVEGIDVDPIVAAIFDIGQVGVAAGATGSVRLSWPKGRNNEISGSLGVDLAPRADGRTPLEGRYEWSAKDGFQSIDLADLRTPETLVRLKGHIEKDKRTDIAVDANTVDLAAADDLMRRIRRALGTADAQLAEFEGRGSFRGRWRGTFSVPVFEGRFKGRDFSYLGVNWGEAEWVGSTDPFAVESRSLVLRRGDGELWLDGRSETGFYGEADGMDLRVRFSRWPAADFLKALQWRLDLTGPLSGEVEVKGRRSAPFGASRIRGTEGQYYGIPYADLDVAAVMKGTVYQVTAGRVRMGGGAVTFHGTLTDQGFFDGAASVRDADIGDILAPPLPHARWGGRVAGDMKLRGALERPWVEGRLTSPRIFIGDEGIGALDATLRGSGDGWVAVTARCASPRLDLSLSGSVGADLPYPASLRLSARDTSLDLFVRALFPGAPGALAATTTGEVTIEGPLTDPERLTVRAEASLLELTVPGYGVRNRTPLRVSLDQGRLQLAELRLSGEGTDLTLEGTATALHDGPLDLELRGSADLGILLALMPQLRGRGSARLSINVAGTRNSPRVDGNLALDRVGIRSRGFPHGLDDLSGVLRVSETSTSFRGVKGTLAGGAIELEGRADYGASTPTSFNLLAKGRGMALRYPEGLRSLLDADVRYYGDTRRQWVIGAIDVRQAVWTRRHDLAAEFIAPTPARAQASTFGDSLGLDIAVRAPGTLRMDNNLATLQASADLKLQGTGSQPVVLGRAEIDRGRVYFQGNTYLIRRGIVDFANPQKLDPFFDIEAETRLRSYRVTLKANGTLDRVYPTLTSDPPLSTVQIFGLLAGADESAISNLTQAQSNQARLAASGAATLAAGAITEEMGLAREAERLLGLNRFSIDPSLVKATNPTARLTIGKRLTPDLSALYSFDLRGTGERVFTLEYILSDRFSLLLTQEEPGGLGVDLRYLRTR